jgi:hypothetical protein
MSPWLVSALRSTPSAQVHSAGLIWIGATNAISLGSVSGSASTASTDEPWLFKCWRNAAAVVSSASHALLIFNGS